MCRQRSLDLAAELLKYVHAIAMSRVWDCWTWILWRGTGGRKIESTTEDKKRSLAFRVLEEISLGSLRVALWYVLS